MIRIPKYKLILAVFDLLILESSFFIAYQLTTRISFHNSVGIYLTFFPFSLLISIIFLFTFQANNLYKIHVFLTKALQIVSIIRSLFYGSLTLIFILFITNFPYRLSSRLFFGFYIASVLTFEFVFRVFACKAFFKSLLKNQALWRKVLIVGAGESGKSLAAKFFVEDFLKIDVAGFVDDEIPVGTEIVSKAKVVGTVADILNSSNHLEIDEVIISIDKISYEELIKMIDAFNKKGWFVRVNSELFKTISENLIVERYGEVPLVSSSPEVRSNVIILLKVLFDKIFALMGLIILFPVFLVIGVIIKLTSEGPIFHRQKRIGKDGKEFYFLKFRSMTVVDGEDEQRKKMMIQFMKQDKINENGDAKVINEQRVTKIGKFLRRYSIDELPQLINVIKGDMSLVGPRPCLPYEYEHYEDWQRERVKVLPGCTGVWQVYGRNRVSFNDSIVMDLYYINNMSPWLDLQLILKTIPVMLFGKGGK